MHFGNMMNECLIQFDVFIIIMTMKYIMQIDVLFPSNYCCNVLSWMQEYIQASRREGKYYSGEELGLVTLNKT
jgi:hypothetical protein